MVMGELATEADVVVIGAGPGGYVAAIRAAQLGKKVLLIDKDQQLGGICLHHGCIPSKAIITAANFAQSIATEAPLMGIKVNKPSIDMKQLQSWKQGIVDKLTRGIETLLKQWKIEIAYGSARFASSRRLRIESKEGTRIIDFKDCIIATGSSSKVKDGFPTDEETILTSTGALQLKQIPKSIAIIGAGYISCELGVALAKLGSKVTMLAQGPRLLKIVTQDLTSIVEHHMEELGINILYECSADAMKKTKAGVEISATHKGAKKKIMVEKLIVAIGRTPNTKELGLENTKVKIDEKGFIVVDQQRRTSDLHIFAIGDVTQGPALAHKASMEGKVAAEVIAGKKSAYDQVVPSVIFTEPEIATVGLNEDEARGQGYEVAIGKFPFSASGRAMTLNATTGFVKVVSEKDSGIILGVHIVGPEATNLIAEATLAIEMGATVDDLSLTIHAHPTLPETIAEAADAVKGMAIHIYQGKK